METEENEVIIWVVSLVVEVSVVVKVVDVVVEIKQFVKVGLGKSVEVQIGLSGAQLDWQQEVFCLIRFFKLF